MVQKEIVGAVIPSRLIQKNIIVKSILGLLKIYKITFFVLIQTTCNDIY
jgi:hypothetical protein